MTHDPWTAAGATKPDNPQMAEATSKGIEAFVPLKLTRIRPPRPRSLAAVNEEANAVRRFADVYYGRVIQYADESPAADRSAIMRIQIAAMEDAVERLLDEIARRDAVLTQQAERTSTHGQASRIEEQGAQLAQPPGQG